LSIREVIAFPTLKPFIQLKFQWLKSYYFIVVSNTGLISDQVLQKFQICFLLVLIKGVKIQKQVPELEKAKILAIDEAKTR
jgi:hypothetical protein